VNALEKPAHDRKKISFDLDEFKQLLEKESGKEYTSKPYVGRWSVDDDGRLFEVRYNNYDVDGRPVILKTRLIATGKISDAVDLTTDSLKAEMADMREQILVDCSEENWDGDNAWAIKEKTIDAAVEWIIKIADRSIEKYRRQFMSPVLEAIHSGTINVLWHDRNLNINANFDVNDEKRDIYIDGTGGDDAIEGFVGNDVTEEMIVDFIEKHRGDG